MQWCVVHQLKKLWKGVLSGQQRTKHIQIHISNCQHHIHFPWFGISKPTSQEITRNEQVDRRAWAKMHGKSVRQRILWTGQAICLWTYIKLKWSLNQSIWIHCRCREFQKKLNEPANSNEANVPPQTTKSEVESFSVSDRLWRRDSPLLKQH